MTTAQVAAKLRVPAEYAQALLADEQRRGHVVQGGPGSWTLTAAGRQAIEPLVAAAHKVTDP
jgi:hypothetical protein